ncbi:hypothetical protein CANCADRAFT_14266, partial [Tortispora caseinolytica NRRL Y-17796]
NHYGYVPSLAPNLIGLIGFALLSIAQLALAVYYREWWFGCAMGLGTLLEFIGYLTRVLSYYDVYSYGYFICQITCLTLAPTFLMAGVYNMLGKLVIVHGLDLVSKLKPATYTYFFLAFDISCIALQGGGGGIASGAGENISMYNAGNNVMLVGIILQVVAMFIFMCLTVLVFYNANKMKKAGMYPTREDLAAEGLLDLHINPSAKPQRRYHPNVSPVLYGITYEKRWKPTVIAFAIAVLLIFTRCMYRVVELAQGWGGYLMETEPYFLVLDGLMILIALILISIYHP